MSDGVLDPLTAGLVPEQAGPVDAELRTFVIADVRGYTAFTHRHGDEKAAKLAGKFARVAREVVEEHHGTVLELRGDEALCVFVSPRQAVRAAVALQRRFVDETRWDRELPLPVGIGIDVGEAVPVEGGFRSGALNMAARLCSIARPGEILATPELTHLARRLDGMSYVVKDQVRLKGLGDPVRPVRVVPDGEDPVAQLVALGALPPKAPPPLAGPAWLPMPLRRRPWLGMVAALVVVSLLATLVIVTRGGDTGLARLSENVAAQVDPGDGRLLAETSVGAGPGAVVLGAGAAWVANSQDGTVSRIDPDSRQVQQVIEVGSAPTGLAFGAGVIWVANSGSGTVSRIDPRNNKVTLTVKVGSGPSALAYGDGALWVVDTIESALFRVDTGNGAAVLEARVGASPLGVTAGDGHVWVSNSGSGTVSDYSVQDHSVVNTINVGNDPRGVTLFDGALWVVNNLDGTVTRINASTAGVTATLPVGAGPVAVAGSDHVVWVAAERAAWLTRIDARRNTVLGHVRTGSTPTAVAASGGLMWLTASVNPALHRGGTLAAQVGFDLRLDPALGYDEGSMSVNVLRFDGLLSLRRTSGARGSIVVPDLASALPTVTGDGRTYTFRLRPGIPWSDGRAVTGEDVRRGLERAVAAGEWPLYGGIVGASDCTKRSCDLSEGVKVDGLLVTIRLVAPDAEFLYKMATAGAVAVPRDTPLGTLGDEVLPSTGPYVVADSDPKHTVLVRNPRFREWSAAAQPAGYPDRIEVRVTGLSPSPAVAGRGDVTSIEAPRLPVLRARYGDRVIVTPTAATYELFLDVTSEPFRNVKARRAVAFAVDRAGFLERLPSPGTITCQTLPPTVPGYRPYCPYTLRRDGSEEWHAPDLAAAQRLVRVSGTAGAHVVLIAPVDQQPAFGVLVQALRSIGYDASLRAVRSPAYFPIMLRAVRTGQAQGGFTGWLADYPAASNFALNQFTCRSITAAANPAGLCDPALDKRIAAAERLQVEDPEAASARWAEIDRAVVDLSPYVPLVTPQHVDVVSSRLQHFQRHPIVGPLYSQAWVR